MLAPDAAGADSVNESGTVLVSRWYTLPGERNCNVEKILLSAGSVALAEPDAGVEIERSDFRLA